MNFFRTFSTTVTYADAFPNRDGPESLLPLLNLELWGAPTSEPARDPKNNNFVYQRFQRRSPTTTTHASAPRARCWAIS